MRKVEETKQYINEMLAKLDESDEIFLKQLCVIIRKHLDRKHLGEKRGVSPLSFCLNFPLTSYWLPGVLSGWPEKAHYMSEQSQG